MQHINQVLPQNCVVFGVPDCTVFHCSVFSVIDCTVNTVLDCILYPSIYYTALCLVFLTKCPGDPFYAVPGSEMQFCKLLWEKKVLCEVK